MDKENPERHKLDELLNQKEELFSLFSKFENRIDNKISSLSGQNLSKTAEATDVGSTETDSPFLTENESKKQAEEPVSSDAVLAAQDNDDFTDALFEQAIIKAQQPSSFKEGTIAGYHTEEILGVEEALSLHAQQNDAEASVSQPETLLEIAEEIAEEIAVEIRAETPTDIPAELPIETSAARSDEVSVERSFDFDLLEADEAVSSPPDAAFLSFTEPEEPCACILPDETEAPLDFSDLELPASRDVKASDLSEAETLLSEAEDILDDPSYNRWAPTRSAFRVPPENAMLAAQAAKLSKENSHKKPQAEPLNKVDPIIQEPKIDPSAAVLVDTDIPSLSQTPEHDLLQPAEETIEEAILDAPIAADEAPAKPAQSAASKDSAEEQPESVFERDSLFGVPSIERDPKRFESFFNEFDTNNKKDFLRDFNTEIDEEEIDEVFISETHETLDILSESDEDTLSDAPANTKYNAIFEDDDALDDEADTLPDAEPVYDVYFDEEEEEEDYEEDDEGYEEANHSDTLNALFDESDLETSPNEVYTDNNLDDVTYENVESVDLGAYKFSAIAGRLTLFVVAMLALGTFGGIAGSTFVRIDYLALFVLCIATILTLDMSFNTTLVVSIVVMLVYLLGIAYEYFFAGSLVSLHHIFWLILIPLCMLSTSAFVQKVKEIILANQLLNEELDELYAKENTTAEALPETAEEE